MSHTHGYDFVIVAQKDQLQSVAIELRATGAEVHAIQTDLRRFEGHEMVQ